MSDRTVYDWFVHSVARFPDLAALLVDGREYSYQELHRRAVALAGRIAGGPGGPPRRIALLGMRSLAAYTGYLAALHLGATVVPLNPRFPAVRNRAVATLAAVDLFLADGSGASAGTDPPGAGPPVLTIDEDAGAGPDLRSPLPPAPTRPADLAYILFTSGSTGRAKGVPISHRNVVSYLEHNVPRYDVRPGDRVSHTFDLTFDPSVFDLFVTWAAGATLVVPQRNELLSPVDHVIEHELTHWFSVPSVISVARQLGRLTGRAPSLRQSMFIGEPLTLDQAGEWHEIAPQARICNVYGPTELTVACTGYELPSGRDSWPETSNGTVPIGPVYDHLEWLVLDERGHPAQEGELVIRGPQRFDGYLDPADDIGRFVSVDGAGAGGYDGSRPLTDRHYYRTGDRVALEQGHWVHRGRLDNQVKLRGYRVELGEIEAAVRGIGGLREVVAFALPHGADRELVVCHTEPGLDVDGLVRRLRRELPTHLVPRRYQHFPQLPLNANGKIDRPTLLARLTGEPTATG